MVVGIRKAGRIAPHTAKTLWKDHEKNIAAHNVVTHPVNNVRHSSRQYINYLDEIVSVTWFTLLYVALEYVYAAFGTDKLF